jgi:RimJ/RimL family protein N-acetyltransferase
MTDLITDRLILHPLSVAEAMRIVSGIAGPGDTWADGFPGEGDRDGARMIVKVAAEQVHAYARTHDQGTLAATVQGPDASVDVYPFTSYRIDCRRDSTAIGTIGFHGPPNVQHQATIGYGLVPHSWGNGYATEALLALIEFCRGRSDVRSLAADTSHDNYASQRVLVKTGFSLVRQDRELLYYELDVD